MTLDTKAVGLDRRMFLRGAAGAGTAIALQALMARSATAQPGPGFDPLGPKPKPAPNNGGYGPLERAPGGELWLPTRTGQRLEIPLPVEWVDIDDPDPDTGGELAVFNQGRAKGGVVFSRLEGAWWGDGAAYIVSTDGGNAQLGQVWEYRPLAGRFGLLRLIYESVDATLLESPDNITVSPRTNGMVLCEDGDGIDLLRGLTRDGKIFDFCRLNSDNDSELAGATFTRNGKVLFFNVQDPGITYAVTGPWRRGAL